MTTPDKRRGTPLWALDRLRSDALASFLADIVAREEDGLSSADCDQVRAALEELVGAAQTLDEDSVLKSLVWKELEAFQQIYAQWNHPTGRSPEARRDRREALRRLRRRRDKIAELVRERQDKLADEFDLEFIRQSYRVMARIVQRAPGLFPNLGRAVLRFEARLA
jgi:hypothetical protein